MVNINDVLNSFKNIKFKIKDTGIEIVNLQINDLINASFLVTCLSFKKYEKRFARRAAMLSSLLFSFYKTGFVRDIEPYNLY